MNEDSYIHPIIQGFLQGAAQAKQAGEFKQNLEQRKLEHQDEVKERAEQVKVARERIQQADKFHADQIKLAAQGAQLQRDQFKLHAIDFVQKFGAEGGDIQKAFGVGDINMPSGIPGVEQTVAPSGMIQLPGMENERVPISSFVTPEKAAGISAGRKKAEVTAVKEAEEPFEQRMAKLKLTGQKELLDYEEGFRAKAAEAKQKFEHTEGELDRKSREKMNAATNWMHLKTSQFSNITPEQIRSVVRGAAMGRFKLDGNNAIERQAMVAMDKMGLQNPDPKMVADLKQSQTLTDGFFQDIRDFAKKYLPSEKDSKLASVKAKVQGLYIKSGITPTDAANKIAQIKANALNVGKTLEGMTGGRVTNLQLGLDLDALISSGITEEQQIKLADNLEKMYRNKIGSVLLGGMSEEQKRDIYREYGVPGESFLEQGGERIKVKYNPKTKEHEEVVEKK